MTSINIRGKEYPLTFDLRAMEILEENDQDVQAVVGGMRRSRRIKYVRELFRAMARSAQDAMGLEETVTGKEIAHCSVAEINAIAEAIIKEQEKAMTVRGAQGNEDDDEKHDVFLEELEAEERKNATAGQGTAPEDTTGTP